MESEKRRGGGGRSAPCGSGHWRGGREEQEEVESEKRQRRKTRRERESPPLPLSVILAHSQVAGVQKNAFSRVADLFFGPKTNKEGLRSAHMARLAVFLKRSGSKSNGEKEKRKKSTLTVLHSFSALSLSLSLLAALPSSLASFTLPSLNGSSRQEWRRRTATAAAAAFSSSKQRRNRCRCGAVTVEHATRRKEPFSVARLEQHVLFGLCRLRQQGPQGTVLEQRHVDDGGRGQ